LFALPAQTRDLKKRLQPAENDPTPVIYRILLSKKPGWPGDGLLRGEAAIVEVEPFMQPVPPWTYLQERFASGRTDQDASISKQAEALSRG
jgi:hypothetical protein